MTFVSPAKLSVRGLSVCLASKRQTARPSGAQVQKKNEFAIVTMYVDGEDPVPSSHI